MISFKIQFLLQLRNFISELHYSCIMESPIEVNDDGVKLKPEIMELKNLLLLQRKSHFSFQRSSEF